MRYLLTISLCLIYSFSILAQTSLEHGGGVVEDQPYSACQSAQNEATANSIHEANVDSLMQEGIIGPAVETTVSLGWPLRMSASLDWNSIGSISNFIDHDTSAGLLIYNCNTSRTYDGHRGMDIPSWPFPWYLANNNFAEIVASADGVITYRVDGEDDDHCQWGLPGGWNAVFIQHCDGSSTRYGHMKKNSLTSKMVGDSVTKGEFLGIVASSGISTGPHIHYEVRGPNNEVLDPNVGTCNPTISSSLWDVQRAYREPRLNVNLTHNAKPEHGCPSTNEFPHMANYIQPGDSVWLATYFQDQTMGDTTFIRLLQPDQTVWQTMQHVSPGTYSKSWWWWRRLLPPAGPYGIWTFEVTYRGDVRKHEFQFGNFPVNVEEHSNDPYSMKIYPNPSHGSSKVSFKSERSEYLRLELYNVFGQLIKVLHEGECKAAKEYIVNLENIEALSFIVLRNDEKVINRVGVSTY